MIDSLLTNPLLCLFSHPKEFLRYLLVNHLHTEGTKCRTKVYKDRVKGSDTDFYENSVYGRLVKVHQ